MQHLNCDRAGGIAAIRTMIAPRQNPRLSPAAHTRADQSAAQSSEPVAALMWRHSACGGTPPQKAASRAGPCSSALRCSALLLCAPVSRAQLISSEMISYQR